MAPKVAFVTGANGISGHAIIENLIRTPSHEWAKIIITSRSPLSHYWIDPRVTFVAIDFLEPASKIVESIKHVCHDVTHAYFASYVHVDDFKKLKEQNVPLFRNFLDTIDAVASTTLQRVCLQTGGKHYGVHLGPVQVPCHEGMPRYTDDGLNFYYAQEDILFEKQKEKSWSHNIIRPNAIIGFTPGKNGMSEALTTAIYFLICREIGDSAAFPGNETWYNHPDDNSYAPSLADLSIFVTTHDHCKDEAFNHTNGDVFVWKYFWPKIGNYFGLEVPEPKFKAKGESQKLENEFSMIEWAKDKKPVWDRICEKYGGKKEAFDWGTWDFFDWAVGKSWMSICSVNKARKFGWDRFDDTYDTWIETYKSFENAGVLPKLLVKSPNGAVTCSGNDSVNGFIKEGPNGAITGSGTESVNGLIKEG